MKKYLSLLLLLCGTSLATPASAQNKPKHKSNKAFTHAFESSEGRTNKARFRKVSKRGEFFDLHFNNIAQFKTAKSNKIYRFRRG